MTGHSGRMVEWPGRLTGPTRRRAHIRASLHMGPGSREVQCGNVLAGCLVIHHAAARCQARTVTLLCAADWPPTECGERCSPVFSGPGPQQPGARAPDHPGTPRPQDPRTPGPQDPRTPGPQRDRLLGSWGPGVLGSWGPGVLGSQTYCGPHTPTHTTQICSATIEKAGRADVSSSLSSVG